jgi:hypothetical protein
MPVPYQDPPTKSKHVAWFVALAILMLGWNFWLPELRNHEAMIGVTARELLVNGHPLALTYHGEPSGLWPLITWLVSLVGLVADRDLNREVVIRLPNLLGALALGWIAWRQGRRQAGENAGLMAAALVMGTLVLWRVGTVAGSDTIFAACLAGAWFVWLRRGKRERHWWQAWFISLFLVLLATLAGGWRALLFFYLPLCFQLHQFHAWRRLASWTHVVALSVVGLALAVLVPVLPPGLSADAVLEISDATSWSMHLLLFPVKTAIYLLPAAIFVWAGYCSWFKSMEQDPLAGSFLRRTCMTIFLACWLWPGTSPRILLALLPLLAVLTAQNLEILLRRGHPVLLRFWDWLSRAGLTMAWLCLLLSALILSRVVMLVGFSPRLAVILAIGSVMVVLLAWWLRRRAAVQPFWFRWFGAVAVLRLGYVVTVLPLTAWYHNEHRDFGNVVLKTGQPREIESNDPISSAEVNNSLYEKVPRQALVLREKLLPVKSTVDPLPGETFYLQRRVLACTDVAKAVKEKTGAFAKPGSAEPEFYVLTGGKKPLNELGYEWEAISPVCYVERLNTLMAWRKPEPNPPPNAPPWTLLALRRVQGPAIDNEVQARMYKGTPKKKEEVPPEPTTSLTPLPDSGNQFL